MLGADAVHARRRGTKLELVRVDERARARALSIATALLSTLRVGAARDEIEEAVRDVAATFDGGASERKMLDGLFKLIDDASTWGEASALDPAEVRRAVFEHASLTRREGRFERAASIAHAAHALNVTPEDIERALYADLRSAQRLEATAPYSPASLVERWERARAQAVLLRAVRVEVHVRCASAGAYRALFRRLKFLRLLHEVHRVEGAWPRGKGRDGHRIVIDGPFSMFESVTKYGLELAMILPLLEECDAFQLTADVRWGAARTPLTFELEGGVLGGPSPPSPPLADEVVVLLERFSALESAWTARPCPDVLEIPGVGLSIPDVLFEHASGARVFLEVLGFWSREAVFKRVEMAEHGLRERMVFAVSKRLRVREDLLDEQTPAALYVYKGTMSARAILEKLEALRTR